MRNSQLSSRLIVASASPNTIAERSRTNRNSECGPYRRAIVRCCGSALWVTLSDSQISALTAPRGRRGRSPGPPTARRRSSWGCSGRRRGWPAPARCRPPPPGVGEPISASRLRAGAALVDPRVLDQPLGVHVEDAGGVVGPLHVAADPEQRLRDPAQHVVPRRAMATAACCCCCDWPTTGVAQRARVLRRAARRAGRPP